MGGKGSGSPETRFKPGVSGNPAGMPRLPSDLRKARAMNKIELERILNKYIHLTAIELKELMLDTETTTIELMVGRIVAEGIKKGDTKHLSFVLDHLIGPLRTRVSIDGGDGQPLSITVGRVEQVDAEDRLKIMAAEKVAK